ncbi:FAD-binding oxidoreductase, partial [Rhizobium ruizarguesonis]
LIENRGLYHGSSPLLLKPGSVEEVSGIMKLATETGTAIVPQTGNTGLVGGQTPRQGKSDVILSLECMNKIRDVDPVANVLVADGGAILA